MNSAASKISHPQRDTKELDPRSFRVVRILHFVDNKTDSLGFKHPRKSSVDVSLLEFLRRIVN